MPYVAGTPLETTDVVVHPTLNFRAIFAGWLVATGIAALLYVGGTALGFSSFNAWNAAATAKGIGVGTAIWVILTWTIALFLGGLFASWFDARNDQTNGTLHGLTVWGLSITATGLWMLLGLGNALHGHAPMGDEMRDGRGGQPDKAMISGDGSVAVLNADVAALLNNRDRDASNAIVAAILAGKDQVAVSLLAASTGTTTTAAMQSLSTISVPIVAARADAKATADRAAHYAAMSMWIAFISLFFALIASAIGGWLGAGHVHRVYHLRKYPATVVR